MIYTSDTAPVQVGFEFEFGSEHNAYEMTEFLRHYLNVELSDNCDGYTKWFRGFDESAYHGVCSHKYEIVTPVMKFNDSLNSLRLFLTMMQETGQKADVYSGLHINMSFIDEELNNIISNNVPAIWFSVPEEEILNTFGRFDNEYCCPLTDDVVSWANEYYNPKESFEVTPKGTSNLFYSNESHGANSIEFHRLGCTTHRRIEFRMTGGIDYFNKYDELATCMLIYNDAMLNGLNEKLLTTQKKLNKFIDDNGVPTVRYKRKRYFGHRSD